MEVMLAWYPAKDLDRAKKFYGEVLGLKQLFEMQGWAEFSHADSGAAAIGVSANPATAGQKGATVVLKVDNIEQTRKQLSERGVIESTRAAFIATTLSDNNNGENRR